MKLPPADALRLPPPEHCDVCASVNVILTTNKIIYGRDYGDWPKCYYCTDCRAMVGCHANTVIPLGRMANAALRRLRSDCHKVFDPIWKRGLKPRGEAYRLLAIELNISADHCHISWLSAEQLVHAATWAANYFKEREHIIDRRKEKRNGKTEKHKNRISRKISVRKYDK